MPLDELRRKYWRVPRTGFEIGVPSGKVYTLMQRGELSGICVSGKWWVSISSAQAYKRRMELEVETAMSAERSATTATANR